MYKLPTGWYCTSSTYSTDSHPLNRIRIASCQVDAAKRVSEREGKSIAAGIFRCVILLLIPLAWAKIRYTAVGTFANHEKETKAEAAAEETCQVCARHGSKQEICCK